MAKRKKEQHHGKKTKNQSKAGSPHPKDKHKEPNCRAKEVRSGMGNKTAGTPRRKGIQGRHPTKTAQISPTRKVIGVARCYVEETQRWMTWDEIQAHKADAKGSSLSPAQRAAATRARAVATHLVACKGKPTPCDAPKYYEGLAIKGLTMDDIRTGWTLYKEQTQ